RERPQDHPDDDGGGREVVAPHEVADPADEIEQDQVDRRLGDPISADGGEHENTGIEQRRRDLQELHPDRDQRQVEHEQHDVADEEGGDQAPDQLRLRLQQQRPRIDAVALERRKHDRGGGRRRQAEREHGYQDARGRGVVGGLRTGDAFDRAFAELLRFRRELLLDIVAQKGRDLGAARGHGPDGKPDGGPAQPWFPRPLPFLERHPERARERDDLVLAEAVARRDVERLPDREQTHRHHDDIDAVEQFRKTEGEARLAGLQVDADETQPDAEEQRRQSPHGRRAQHGRYRYEREHHEREIVGGSELERPIHHHGREEGDTEGADRAGNERADGRGRDRRAGAAVARHLVTLERRDDGGALARRVEQNRRGRAAIHRAVVDAGEKNECRGRLDLEGDRQEQRDGQRRTEAGKDADRGAQRGAEEA